MTLSVSVALCTHNGAAFVEDQVRSILIQTRPISELVVSDDASTDDTVAVVERVVAELAPTLNPRILRNRPALGVAANFEQAIRACTGDLIALSDQDDVWANDRLARVVPAFESDPSLLLAHGDARLVDDAGMDSGSTLFGMLRISPLERRLIDRGTALDAYLRRNLVTGATTILRRSLADQALPIPAGWIHDEWLGIMAAVLGRAAILPGKLVDYRQHASNQIGVTALTVTGRIRKLREPRTERNRNLFVRAQAFADRVQDMGELVDTRALRLAWAKLEHERYRLALPPGRLRRALPVFTTWVRGDYGRYGLGAQDAVRDLVQPT